MSDATHEMAEPIEPRVSIVIPVLNEAEKLPGLLQQLARQHDAHEVIVADGGSDDGSVEIATAAPAAIVVHSARGRGKQLNAGADAATGEVLLFLHADVRLPPDAIALARQTVARPGNVAGAFRIRHECRTPRWWSPLLPFADLRSHITDLPYGDQALFVTREVFDAVGGYPEQPLMEDVELALRLRERGRIDIVDATVTVCARRFEASPFLAAVYMNTFPALYRLGLPPACLARAYGNPR